MKSKKARTIIVLIFTLIFALISIINIRGTYLQYSELGENYIKVFETNLKYKYIIFGLNFIILYIVMYFTNRGINKGLKSFFEKEKKEVPKFPNKSLSYMTSVIISSIVSNVFLKKLLLLKSNASFGITDNVFGFDIGFYMFQKPFIIMLLIYITIVIAILTLYTIIYYLIIFNKYFDGIDRNMIKNSLFLKKLYRNVILSIIPISLITILNTTNITLNRMITIKTDSDKSNNIEIIGAGYTDVMLQRWTHLIFAFVTLIFTIKAVQQFKKGENFKAIKNLAVIPGYLVLMFFVLLGFNLVFVNSNVLDKQKEYLETNIKYTKNAYNIYIDEQNLEKPQTVSKEQIAENSTIIDNIRIVNNDVILKNLEYYQKGTGYYSYRYANLAKYQISGKEKLVYVSPREISNSGRTYNNKTYEYTHGIGQIVIDGTSVTQDGEINYIQKDISGKDDALNTKQQGIYFGLETNDTIATNTKNKQEYDYTDSNSIEHTSSYSGKAGLKLGFFDRLVLGIKTGNLKLAFSGEMTENSKILINRNIIKRAKQAMPFLIYDENPYTVVTDDGRIVWVLDAYTTSSQYPYSQFEPIEHDGIKEKINYIRNSVKVIIDSYDGTMNFYLTDENDPIAMAYAKIYPDLFTGKADDIPQDISSHFVYPKYLYNVQAELLKTYHNVKYDVLYRKDDLWDFAKMNSSVVQKSSGTILEPYYTMVKDGDNDKIGLIQIYTPSGKQNLISYLVGTVDGSTNKLALKKFSQDSGVIGPMQLDTQIEQDENISAEIKDLSKAGTKVTKDMVIVPIDKTVLYVESIYQTMLNEESRLPLLKKVVVASGDKVAIGDNLSQAIENLLSIEASNIEIENTDDIDGLIDSIVKANKNLKESTNNSDWELMGSDVKKLQSLIDSLEKEKLKEDEKKAEEEKLTTNTNVEVTNNSVD